MRTRLAALATVAVLVVLTACGDDDGAGTTESGGGGDAPVALEGDVNDEGSEDATGSSELELEADDFYFGPTYVKASPGSTLSVTIENEGDEAHTFTIDDQDIDSELDPGATADVEVTVPDDGIVNFYCRFHLSQGMQGAVFTEAAESGGGGDSDSGDGGGTGGGGY